MSFMESPQPYDVPFVRFDLAADDGEFEERRRTVAKKLLAEHFGV